MQLVTINVDVKQKYLDQAAKLRELYDRHGVKVFELLGSPGSGKTAIAEAVIDKIKDKYKIAYLGGDVASTLDAERVSKHGVDAVEINTGGICHLEPAHVFQALNGVDLSKYNIMIIENVGNLICPINFPLGAHKRVLVVSVAEGEDKFVKHPMSTKAADVIVISKVDLANAIGVDVKKMEEDARRLNPKAPIIKASVRTGEGIDELVKALGL